jgi:NAD(P)-dependent dehydrogenase (short-subunit alcohol dehydrogenase family)
MKKHPLPGRRLVRQICLNFAIIRLNRVMTKTILFPKFVSNNLSMDNQKVWLVTNTTEGLGCILVKQLLNNGHKVAAMERNPDELTKAIGDCSDDFLPQAVDLASSICVEDAIDRTIACFGKIDRVVINAGHGLAGNLEELTDREVRDNFNTNVFGMLNVIRGVMMYLRQQRSGHIFNISPAGELYDNLPGQGIYYAAKFAVQGFTGSLASEVKDFGVRVTIVSPEGHPEKIAAAIMRAAEEPDTPFHLQVGRGDCKWSAQKKVSGSLQFE